MKNIECKICSSKDNQDLVYHQGIYKCKNCGSLYRSNSVDYNFYEESDYWYKGDEELKLYQKSFFVWFENYIKQGHAIEFGAADGDFTYLLRRRIDNEFYIFYSEIKDLLRNEYQKENIIKAIGTFENVNISNKFTSVFMIDVIEHINNPIEAFKKVFDMLKYNGRFFLVTNDGDSLNVHNEIFYHQEHVCMFTRKAFDIVCKKTGFRIHRYWKNPQGMSFIILEKK